MRMRARAHLEDRMEACESVWIRPGEELDTTFLTEAPLHIEIGCGKGSFITECARQNTAVHYLAFEKVSNIMILAMEKAVAQELSNIRFLAGDFAVNQALLPPESVARIYLNFSDPWPKAGYAKRRLTHGRFLELYKRILQPGGMICFKTDNRALFDFSVATLPQSGFTLQNVTYDLPADAPGNIVTEYEARFRAEGVPINRLEAVKE